MIVLYILYIMCYILNKILFKPNQIKNLIFIDLAPLTNVKNIKGSSLTHYEKNHVGYHINTLRSYISLVLKSVLNLQAFQAGAISVALSNC